MNPLTELFKTPDKSSTIANRLIGSHKRKRAEFDANLLEQMIRNVAGISLSGIAGSGKSVALRALIKQAIETEWITVAVLDPPGTLVHDLKADIASIGPRAVDRTHIIVPGDPNWPVKPINPLHVDKSTCLSDYEYDCKLACKAAHAAALTLTPFGDGGFEGRPNQATMTLAICKGLALLGLSLADFQLFLPSSPFYKDFMRCLPDDIAYEFESLERLSEGDRQTMIGSTIVRFNYLMQCPNIEAMLGMSDPTKCMNTKQLIADKSIMLFDLATYGSMGLAERNTVANFYLSELLMTVVQMRPEEWKNHMILLVADEFPVFANCKATADMVSEFLPQTRKMGFRFCPAFQGVHPFDGGPDNQLLRTLTSNCHNLVFGHKDTVDCKYWGDLMALPELDPTREKYREYEDQQYIAGHRLVTTINYSCMMSSSETKTENAGGSFGVDQSKGKNSGIAAGKSSGKSASNTHTDSASNTNTDNEATTLTNTKSHADNVRESFHTAHSQMKGAVDATSQGDSKQVGSSHASQEGSSDAVQNGASEEESLTVNEGESAGTGISKNSNWARAKATARTMQQGITYNQAYQPIHAWRKVVKFLELMSFDDQEKLAARDVANLQVGTCFGIMARQMPIYIEIPMPRLRYSERSKVFQENLTRLMERFDVLPCYEMGAKIQQYRETWTVLALQNLIQSQKYLPPQQLKALPSLDDPTAGI